jgi:uncharacterized protein (TIGR02001 family)
MKHAKTILASALVAATGVAQAELSANLGVQSNYYFRGITQTNDGAAVSGGIDYNHDSGFYVGTWMSNIDFTSAPKANVEVDLYTGFGGDIGDSGFSYDLSAWYYYYPGAGGDLQNGELDYSEASGSLSYGPATLTVAYTFWAEAKDLNNPATDAVAQPFQEGDLWYQLSLEPDWNYQGFSPTASVGYYDFDQDGDFDINTGGSQDLNYTTWTVGVTKDAGDFGSFSVNYVQNDYSGNADQFWGSSSPKFWVGWAKDF